MVVHDGFAAPVIFFIDDAIADDSWVLGDIDGVVTVAFHYGLPAPRDVVAVLVSYLQTVFAHVGYLQLGSLARRSSRLILLWRLEWHCVDGLSG